MQWWVCPVEGAPQAKIEVCCERGVGSYMEGLCNEEQWWSCLQESSLMRGCNV